jgi:hypothetical protein
MARRGEGRREAVSRDFEPSYLPIGAAFSWCATNESDSLPGGAAGAGGRAAGRNRALPEFRIFGMSGFRDGVEEFPEGNQAFVLPFGNPAGSNGNPENRNPGIPVPSGLAMAGKFSPSGPPFRDGDFAMKRAEARAQQAKRHPAKRSFAKTSKDARDFRALTSFPRGTEQARTLACAKCQCLAKMARFCQCLAKSLDNGIKWVLESSDRHKQRTDDLCQCLAIFP